MRRQYSEELLKDIHIRLDRQGLDGLTEKEIMVLLLEEIVLLSDEIAESTDRIIATIHQTVRPIQFWAKVIGSGLWAVAASLIASIIFKACGGL